ncbi:MAG: peroxiredoxin [Burkholderiales bacterium]
MKWLTFAFALAGAFGWRAVVAGELPAVGNPAPSFNLPDQSGKIRTLDEFRGRWLVLYFYPEDDTPGCTKQACSFRDDLAQLSALGAQVVGVSVDTSSSHAEFAKKYSLPFPLLADEKGEVAKRYGSLTNLGVMKLAKRNTFLVDPEGKIAKVYVKASTSRNSADVTEDLKKFAKD